MTDAELVVLLKFLCGGLLAGVIGRWLDGLATYIKGK